MRMPLAENIIRANSGRNTFGASVRRTADGRPRAHQGWDFSAAIGTPCFAVATGTVVTVEERGDYGKQLLLDIGGERWAFYAHLATIEVSVGQVVTEGQRLGTTGNSGNAVNLEDADDHLHFEARYLPHPGHGLTGRLSPMEWFKVCPLHDAVVIP